MYPILILVVLKRGGINATYKEEMNSVQPHREAPADYHEQWNTKFKDN